MDVEGFPDAARALVPRFLRTIVFKESITELISSLFCPAVTRPTKRQSWTCENVPRPFPSVHTRSNTTSGHARTSNQVSLTSA